MWTIRVAGEPAPKGSMKCIGTNGRHQLTEDDKTGKGKPWRRLVTKAGERIRVHAGDALTEGPVSVEVTWTLDRPASVPLRKRAWPAVRNADLDKLCRMVLDAFSPRKGEPGSGLWGDDSQVVQLVARKAYFDTPNCPDVLDRPGAVIRVSPMSEVVGRDAELHMLRTLVGHLVTDYGDRCCDNQTECGCSMAQAARYVGIEVA